MNEKFYELPEEKRLRIINAGFEVFGQNDYRHASTEEIAAKAGISKGLLFYYFHDKKTLYLYLFDYAQKLMTEQVVDGHFSEITDVFEMFEYAAGQKYKLLQLSPYIMDFCTRAFYSEGEAVSEELRQRTEKITAEIYSRYFSNLDYYKFKDGINPYEILQMLIWTSDGYLHERQRQGTPLDLEDLMDKYSHWSDLFKRISYKEEYLK
jgi:TetR/AcrR family transcriptional regulator